MLERPLRAALLSLAIAAPPALADDFADFRIPAHQVFDWSAKARTSAARGASGLPENEWHESFWEGVASTAFYWLADSDPTLTAVSVDAAVATGRRSSARESVVGSPFMPGRTSLEREDQNAGEHWSASIGHRRYPWAVPVGLAFSVAAIGDYTQTWASLDEEWQRDVTTADTWTQRAHDEDWRYQYSLSSAATIGLGRVRDATGVYEARILEERLRQAGDLARALSREARRKLAALMHVRGSYSQFRDRPGKDLWEAIERILREDGALRDEGLDAQGVSRAGEPFIGRGRSAEVPQSMVQRLTGAFVGPTVVGTHSRWILRRDSDFLSEHVVDDTLQSSFRVHGSLRVEQDDDNVSGGARGEWHRPIGPEWQIDLAGQVVVPLRRQDDGIETAARGSVYWLATDRWLAGGFVHQRRTLRQGADSFTAIDAWGWNYGMQVTRYLEDRLSVTLEVSEGQSRARSDQGVSGVPRFERSGRLSLELSYRFMGRFSAPGLLEVSL